MCWFYDIHLCWNSSKWAKLNRAFVTLQVRWSWFETLFFFFCRSGGYSNTESLTLRRDSSMADRRALSRSFFRKPCAGWKRQREETEGHEKYRQAHANTSADGFSWSGSGDIYSRATEVRSHFLPLTRRHVSQLRLRRHGCPRQAPVIIKLGIMDSKSNQS